MSWGTELWDQNDNVAAHLQKGIEFCEKFSHFLKERCIIENEYASKLKRLVKSYQPKKKDEDCEFSCIKGFQGMISEMHDLAGQHEVIAENVTTGTQKNLQLLIQQLKNDRKRYMQDFSKQNNSMQSQWLQLDKIKKLYEKAFREAERTRELFAKADADLALSRADVEKARTLMNQKQQMCDSAKLDYAEELKKTNEYQKQHYYKLVPEISQRFQDLEENRVNSMKTFYQECVEIEKKVLPIIGRCIEGMGKAVEGVSSSVDIRVVADRYKSGFIPPADIAFEDLNNIGSTTIGASPTGSVQSLDSAKTKPVAPKNSSKFRIFGGSKQTEEKLPKEDFSHLQPAQQKKKLVAQINTIKRAITKETAERDGLQKMQEVYQKNKSLGDPQSVAKQLEESAQKLDQLHADLRKFQTYLAEADGSNNSTQDSWSTSGSNLKSPPNNEESISKINQQPQRISDAQSERTSNTGVEMLVDKPSGDHRLSAASIDSFEGPDEDQNPVEEEASSSISEPSVGTCTALYPFTAQNEGSLSMQEGEKFDILERDQGDGWIHVRNSAGDSGFIPSAYMECFWNTS